MGNTIKSNDILMATLTQGKKTIGTFRLCGISSFAAVIKSLSKLLKGSVGLVTLTLHNTTQGWREIKKVMFENREPVFDVRNAIQLTLF